MHKIVRFEAANRQQTNDWRPYTVSNASTQHIPCFRLHEPHLLSSVSLYYHFTKVLYPNEAHLDMRSDNNFSIGIGATMSVAPTRKYGNGHRSSASAEWPHPHVDKATISSRPFDLPARYSSRSFMRSPLHELSRWFTSLPINSTKFTPVPRFRWHPIWD